MKMMISRLVRILRNEEGQDLVEYALLLALLGVGTIAATSKLATAIITIFNGLKASLLVA